MSKHRLKTYLHLFKEAFQLLKENHPVKFASAIAYFSFFALPSIFLILVQVLGLMFDQAEIFQELRKQLETVIGPDGAEILVVVTENYREKAAESTLTTLGYTISVFWLSTQLFRLFQNSLNDLWQIKPDYKNLWQKLWVERGLTFLLVLVTGLMFFASVVVERVLEFGIGTLGLSGMEDEALTPLVNTITAVIVFLWFSFLYKVLPAVKIKYGPTFVGAAVTTILFFMGIWLLWYFVVERDLESLYDVAASIILVGLWVFYTSLIFLYGASFTKVYAALKDKNIAPASYAHQYKLVPATEKEMEAGA